MIFTTFHNRRTRSSRLLFVLGALLAGFLTTQKSQAQTFDLVPLNLGDGVTVSGTLTTDGSTGLLTASNFTGWNITVTQKQEQVFTRANSRLSSSLVTTDRSTISVANPDGSLAFLQGGRNLFRSLTLADFTGSSGTGGQAGFFDEGRSIYQMISLPTNDPNYTAASLLSHTHGHDVFQINPLDLGDGYTVTGTLTSDGKAGDLNLTDWNLLLKQTLSETFDPTNSRFLGNSDLVYSDGKRIKIANPDGMLAFGTNLRHGHYIQLADFTYGNNQAVFQGFTYAQTSQPLTDGNLYVAAAIPGADVPEPGIPLMAGAFLIVGSLLVCRSRRSSGRSVRL